jgi:carboxypeptidase PM20D1
VLYTWKGKSDAAPVVLMAHYDVVPVEEDRWEHPPFCAEIIEGELWGRGTLDTKITLLGVMEAAEKLIGEGFVPANDIYMAFAGDEEIAGPSAPAIVKALEERGVTPAFVLDEGGAIVDKVFPGVANPIAVVGIGEKGMANIQLTVKGKGGHASQPPKHTALGVLAKAICACEKHPFKAHMTLPVRALFTTVGAYAPFGLKLVFANLWCFGGLLTKAAALLGGDMNAMMRTTQSFNMAQGSKQANVIPSAASAVANLRLLNVTTPEDARAHMEKVIKNPDVKVEILHCQEASPYADPGCAEFAVMEKAIRHTWGEDVIVSPYLMMACSDSRHYSRICKNVFKFSAVAMTKEQRALIHNENERIAVEKVWESVEFFARLIRYL